MNPSQSLTKVLDSTIHSCKMDSVGLSGHTSISDDSLCIDIGIPLMKRYDLEYYIEYGFTDVLMAALKIIF